MSGLKPMNNDRGGALLIVLITVVLLGLGLGMAGSTWKTLMQREREEELLWRGTQIRKAIESYVVLGRQSQPPVPPPGGQRGGGAPIVTGNFPLKMEDLVQDARHANPKHHLRKLYKDPITGEDFELIKDPAGRIKGVRSPSKEEPFKKDGFPPEYEDFIDAESYNKWEFVFEPGRTRSQNTTAPGSVNFPGQPVSPAPGSPGQPPLPGSQPPTSPDSPSPFDN